MAERGHPEVQQDCLQMGHPELAQRGCWGSTKHPHLHPGAALTRAHLFIYSAFRATIAGDRRWGLREDIDPRLIPGQAAGRATAAQHRHREKSINELQLLNY